MVFSKSEFVHSAREWLFSQSLSHICEIHGETFDDEWLDGVDNNTRGNTTINYTDTGMTIREAFMAYFQEH